MFRKYLVKALMSHNITEITGAKIHNECRMIEPTSLCLVTLESPTGWQDSYSIFVKEITK